MNRSLVDCVTLLSNQLSVFGVSVEFAEPSDLAIASLLRCQFFAHLRLEMECFWLLGRLKLNTVTGGENFVRDWTPSISLDPLVPTVMVVLLRLVKANINALLLCVLLQLVVVAWCEGVDVDYSTVRENLVVDQGWETIATKSESDMAARGSIKESCLGRVDTLEQLHWLTLLLEIDQIFVVVEDFDVCEGAPGVLNLLSGDLVLRLLCDLASMLLIATPGPLDLNRGDMIHRESMVLEEAPCEGHLVGCLDQSGAEVSHRLILTLRHVVKVRREELLAQALRC